MKNREKDMSKCFGCGQILKVYSILVCASCLGDECDKFEKLAVEEEEIEINFEDIE